MEASTPSSLLRCGPCLVSVRSCIEAGEHRDIYLPDDVILKVTADGGLSAGLLNHCRTTPFVMNADLMTS